MKSRILAARLRCVACCRAAWHAQERILVLRQRQSQVAADGSLDVTERIAVRAEGNNIRRGIYRDFPTRYKDRYGNRVVVDFQMIDVQRNGKPEPWFTENTVQRRAHQHRQRRLPARARRIHLHPALPHHAPARVSSPTTTSCTGTRSAPAGSSDRARQRRSAAAAAVPIDEMKAEGYTGAQGTQGHGLRRRTSPRPGVARWRLTQPLAPHEGITVVL